MSKAVISKTVETAQATATVAEAGSTTDSFCVINARLLKPMRHYGAGKRSLASLDETDSEFGVIGYGRR